MVQDPPLPADKSSLGPDKTIRFVPLGSRACGSLCSQRAALLAAVQRRITRFLNLRYWLDHARPWGDRRTRFNLSSFYRKSP